MPYQNPDGTKGFQFDPGVRFMVRQHVRMVEDVNGFMGGLGYSRKEEFPVLFVPHAQYADKRWVPALEEGRCVNFLQRWMAKEKEKHERLRKKYMDHARDWAKDQYRNFIKWTDQWNLANYAARHRGMERRREFEQKHGRRRGRVRPKR
jgi:hypothetical protein